MPVKDSQDIFHTKSVFRNDTKYHMSGRIFVGPMEQYGRPRDDDDASDRSPDAKREHPAHYIEWSAAPGETIEIESRYERALHDVRDGVIVGGDAPLITRISPPQTYRLHPCLIPTVDVPFNAALTPEEMTNRLRIIDAAGLSTDEEVDRIGAVVAARRAVADVDARLAAKARAKKERSS